MRYPKLARVSGEGGGYNASRTSMDLPISQLVLRTAEAARGPIVKLPTMGGSVPLYLIEDILHAPWPEPDPAASAASRCARRISISLYLPQSQQTRSTKIVSNMETSKDRPENQ
jgi:hypothetical protein